MKEPTDCAHLGMGSWVGLGWVKNENLKKKLWVHGNRQFVLWVE